MSREVPGGGGGSAGRFAFAAAVLVATLASSPATARAGEATTTLFADGVGRYGPAAAMLFAGVARRWSEEDGPSPLARGRYAQASVAAGVNPAYAQAAFAGEWAPVAVLQLRLEYDLYGFFGANGGLLRLPSKDAKFGTSELDALAGHEERGLGHRVMFSPVLRARLGRLVLRNQTDLDWYALSQTPGWYYESEYDTLLARRDWLVANRTVLFADLAGGPPGTTLLVGPMYDVTRSDAAAIVRQRAGVALFFAPAGAWLGFDRVSVYALGGVNLSDRNRPGEPFGVLGFTGQLDVGR